MPSFHPGLCGLLFLVQGLSLFAGQEPFRLAIIAEEESPLHGVLEATLSQSEAIAVVERHELERLVSEKRLGTFISERKFAALGNLLAADGLLVIEKLRLPDGADEMTARLISVRNGACLSLLVAPSDNRLGDWAEGIKREVLRLAPMARIENKDAVPICVVGVRAPIFTPEMATVEGAIMRLLEARLGSTPGVLLLDRRRMGDVSFERSIEAADLPSLAEGAVWIDGSVETMREPGSLAAKLRLRDRSGRALGEVSSVGTLENVPALTDALAFAVLEKLDTPPPEVGGGFEAREFFEEAVWAWENGLFDRAEESLDAAVALGEDMTDVFALKAWLLAERAYPQGIFFQGKTLKREPPPLGNQIALMAAALNEFRKFEAANANLQRIHGQYGRYHLERRPLKRDLIGSASGFLAQADLTEFPSEIQVLRDNLRALTGIGNGRPSLEGKTLGLHVREWADSGPELVGYYEDLLRTRRNDLGLLQYFPRSRELALGPRFQDATSKAAWEAMSRRLLDDPATRTHMLFVLAGNAATPTEQKAYREFLADMRIRGDELYRSGELKALLWGDMTRGDAFRKFTPERTETFSALCRSVSGYVSGILDLTRDLQIPAGEEQPVWEVFTQYRSKCIGSANDATARADMEKQFAEASGNLMKSNPVLHLEQSSDSLVVSRFWHPYGLKDWPGREFVFNEMWTEGRSVWVIGSGIGPDKILEVELPEITVRTHRVPGAEMGTLAVSPQTVWILHGFYPEANRPMQMVLSRLDRANGEVREFPLPSGDAVELAGDRVFVRFGHPHTAGGPAGLLEVNPDSGAVSVIISSRRRPPQSPVDASSPLGVTGVGLGPGGQVHFVISGQSAGIFNSGNDWKMSSSVFWPDVLHSDDLTLLAGAKGEAILLDPKQSHPILWLASPDSEQISRDTARWLAPRPRMDMRFGAAAFRRDELFMVERNQNGQQNLRWWFDGSPREGIGITLRFELPNAQVAELERAYAISKNWRIDIDSIQNPERLSSPLQVLAGSEGVIVHCRAHGFWFIPNADLATWRQQYESSMQSSEAMTSTP